jgi:hypothetical protein
VFGSGAVSQTGTCHSRMTAIGFGPRTMTFVLPSAAMNWSRGWRVSITLSSALAPTPVRKMIASNSPRTSASPNSSAVVFVESGTSFNAGATVGCPPKFRMSVAISVARRLSSDSTRKPPKSGLAISTSCH